MILKLIRKFKRDGIKIILLIVVRKVIQSPRIIFYKFLSDIKPVNNKAVFNQPAIFAGKGTISLTNCFIGVWPSPQFFSTYAHIEARSKNAFITIGKNTWLNNNATLIADKTSITIGENVLIGHNVFICDSDFHGLEVENRSNGNYDAISVEIGNHVFIGANVTILKGVHIGNNSVVASGSIVSSDIPENVLAGGIPAKVLKNII